MRKICVFKPFIVIYRCTKNRIIAELKREYKIMKKILLLFLFLVFCDISFLACKNHLYIKNIPSGHNYDKSKYSYSFIEKTGRSIRIASEEVSLPYLRKNSCVHLSYVKVNSDEPVLFPLSISGKYNLLYLHFSNNLKPVYLMLHKVNKNTFNIKELNASQVNSRLLFELNMMSNPCRNKTTGTIWQFINKNSDIIGTSSVKEYQYRISICSSRHNGMHIQNSEKNIIMKITLAKENLKHKKFSIQ